MKQPPHDIRDPAPAAAGRDRIQWAAREMPVLTQLTTRFSEEKPFDRLSVGGCLHITTETANLAVALQAAGADLALCASNPLNRPRPITVTSTPSWTIAR